MTSEPLAYCLTKALLQSLPGILVMVDDSATKHFNAMRITLMRSSKGAIDLIPALIYERSGGETAQWRTVCWEQSLSIICTLSCWLDRGYAWHRALSIMSKWLNDSRAVDVITFRWVYDW
jgi:hypothetical protein